MSFLKVNHIPAIWGTHLQIFLGGVSFKKNSKQISLVLVFLYHQKVSEEEHLLFHYPSIYPKYPSIYPKYWYTVNSFCYCPKIFTSSVKLLVLLTEQLMSC